MTQRLFKKLSLLFIGSILFSCSLEDEYVEKQQYQQSSKYSIERKSLKELLQDQKFSTAFNKLPKQNVSITTPVTGRTVMEQDYGFTISENIPAQVMSTEYLTSYTFYISRSTPSIDFFENLVVQTDTLGTTKAYIVKYSLNTPVSYFAEHDSYIVDGQRELTSILYNANEANAKIQYVGDDDCTLYTLMCPYGHPHPASLVCIGEGQDVYWVSDNSNCAGSGNNSGDGDSGASNPGSDSGNGGSGNTGGTTGGEENNDGLVDPGTCKGCGGVVTVPLPELEEALNTPCDKLKELSDPDKQNIIPGLDALKQNYTTDSSKEYGIRLKYDPPSTYTNIQVAGNSDGISVNYIKGQTWRGGAHTHPKIGYSMFSWGDVQTLAGSYDYASSANQPYVVNILVCYNSNTGNFDTYAIKVDNYTTLQNAIDADWNNPAYAVPPSGDPAKDKENNIKKIHADQEKVFKLSIKNNPLLNEDEALEKAFLQQFANHGISLYKMNAAGNWDKLTLDANNNVIPTPCP